MTLSEFYRDQIMLLFQEFEREWEATVLYEFGYQWNRRVNSYQESFRIVEIGESYPYLMYTMTLSEDFKKTNIFDVAKQYNSRYEMSISLYREKLLLSIGVSCNNLNESVGGFLFRARGDLLDIIDFTVYS
ncbi:hypothetical protein [Paenibacillus cremeus]|uniref:Uncharacterized protein n=1 Tax=Paenibacillus cremeus TaxID=2163881 RepID=A0A559KBH6_9BACL|nr:hypothetical protein [Paenibacillus cremeus]TVY09492.1 hypothetical protein FPZ49_13725 [Paenibacillus cremeus]